MLLTRKELPILLIYTGCSGSSWMIVCNFVWWLDRPNIPLSASHTSRILDLNNHTTYIPPHPQQGTDYHRYVLLLLQQPPLGASEYSFNLEARVKADETTSMHLNIPIVFDKQRKGFSLRSFMREWGFDMRKGGGAHMWREVWDEHVSTIYKNILGGFPFFWHQVCDSFAVIGAPEPRYRLPRKSDPAPKQLERYISWMAALNDWLLYNAYSGVHGRGWITLYLSGTSFSVTCVRQCDIRMLIDVNHGEHCPLICMFEWLRLIVALSSYQPIRCSSFRF